MQVFQCNHCREINGLIVGKYHWSKSFVSLLTRIIQKASDLHHCHIKSVVWAVRSLAIPKQNRTVLTEFEARTSGEDRSTRRALTELIDSIHQTHGFALSLQLDLRKQCCLIFRTPLLKTLAENLSSLISVFWLLQNLSRKPQFVILF